MSRTADGSGQGQGDAGFSLDNHRNKRKHGYQDQEHIQSGGMMGEINWLD